MATLNHEIAGRDEQQWYEDNKEKVKEQTKNYRRNNLDKVSERVREYNEKNRDTILQNKREYYSNNKDKIKEYIEKTKKCLNKSAKSIIRKILKMAEKNRAKTICSCGQEVLKRNLTKHQRTKKHQEALNNLNYSNNVSLQSDDIRTNGRET